MQHVGNKNFLYLDFPYLLCCFSINVKVSILRFYFCGAWWVDSFLPVGKYFSSLEPFSHVSCTEITKLHWILLSVAQYNFYNNTIWCYFNKENSLLKTFNEWKFNKFNWWQFYAQLYFHDSVSKSACSQLFKTVLTFDFWPSRSWDNWG